MEHFWNEKIWPCWVLQPNEKFFRNLPEHDDAYEDFGNENWEALVNLMNLSSAIPSVYGQAIFNAHATAVNGDRVKKSGVGSYNFRGNVVERLLTHLLHAREEEALALDSPASPF